MYHHKNQVFSLSGLSSVCVCISLFTHTHTHTTILEAQCIPVSPSSVYVPVYLLVPRFLPFTHHEQVAANPDRVFCGTFSDDGDIFMSACQSSEIHFYDTSRGGFRLKSSVPARDVSWAIVVRDNSGHSLTRDTHTQKHTQTRTRFPIRPRSKRSKRCLSVLGGWEGVSCRQELLFAVCAYHT